MAVTVPGAGAVKYPDPTTNVVNRIFKEFYLPSVRDLLNSKRILVSLLTRNSQDVSGEHAVIALNVGRNEGIGFIGEQGKLPDPGRQRYERAYYRMRYYYGRILFTGPAVASSRNDRGAFIRILDGEVRGVARDMQHEQNRVMYGDGSGVLATVQGTAGSNVVTENPGGFNNTGPGTQYLRPGMRVALVSYTAGAPPVYAWRLNASANRGYKILSVDHSTGQIALDNGNGVAAIPTGTAAGDFIVRVSEETATVGLTDSSLWNEPWGLAAAVDEGNPQTIDLYGGIDATVEGVWNAAVVDNGGIPILFNQGMLEQAHDAIDQQSDGHVKLWLTTFGIRRQYLDQLVQAKRYTNTMKLDGGWSALDYNGQPLVVDKDCTRGRVYGLDLDTLYLFSETDYQWMDDGTILRRLDNYDAFQATLYRYFQMGGDARNRNVVIKDIID